MTTHDFGQNAYIVCTRYDYPFSPYEMEPRIRALIDRLGIPYVRIEQREYKKEVRRKILFSYKLKETLHYVMVVVVPDNITNYQRCLLHGACNGFSYGLHPHWTW